MSDPVWLDKEPWIPLRPLRSASSKSRRSQDYVDVCAQFQVLTARRYRPRNGQTFCNIYAWDCTSALGCEIPHWYDQETGEKTAVGKGTEMSANAMFDWLSAERGDWRRRTEQDAYAGASLGFPTVAAWKNPDGGPGHVALVLSGKLCAAAGARNVWLAPLVRTFGDKQPQFFMHN